MHHVQEVMQSSAQFDVQLSFSSLQFIVLCCCISENLQFCKGQDWANWWSSCVASDALEILCLMSFFFLATVMLFSISCFNQWTKYVTVLLSSWCSTLIIIVAWILIKWWAHAKLSTEWTHAASFSDIFFLLSTDLVLDELMCLKWSVLLQILLLLWWYLTDHTLLIHLDTCNQYLFLIVYHEVCYHRMTLAALTVTQTILSSSLTADLIAAYCQ
jgi:hypothetical protein